MTFMLLFFLCVVAMSVNSHESSDGIIAPDSIYDDVDIMSIKEHGTCASGISKESLRWNCDLRLADQICCFNRHYAEHSKYFLEISKFMDELVICMLLFWYTK